MSWWIVFSLLAIFIKLWLLVAKRVQLRDNWSLELLLYGFLAMNLVEFIGFFSMEYNVAMLALLHLYYISCTLMVAAMLNLFLRMNGAHSVLININWLIAGLMVMAFFIPQGILAGVEYLHFTATRIAGPYYDYWVVYIVSTLLLAMIQLANVYLQHKAEEKGKQVLVIFLGLMPFVLTAITVMIAMQLGYKVNGGVILSLMVCTFLISLIWAENKHSVFNVLAHVPNTEEYRVRHRLHNVFADIELHACAGKPAAAGFNNSVRELEESYAEMSGDAELAEKLKWAEHDEESARSSSWLTY